MPELFKNIYSPAFFDSLTKALIQVFPDFDKASFLQDIYDDHWEQRELKQRMRHIATVLKAHAYANFDKNAEALLSLIQHLEENGIREESIEYMFIPDFIEHYGLAHYSTAIRAIERITQFSSCEFTVRPFIIKFESKMLRQLQLWSNHPHPQVRRLATEGCRPRLPWAMAIPALKKDPSPIIPILQRLKNDPEETVRRSVANNLNDISKDHPLTVIQLAKKWQGGTKATDWVIKHGCRTLLKQGNLEAMRLFGFGDVEKIEIDKLHISTPKVKIGSKLAFSFDLKNTDSSPLKVRLEYGIHYLKANGSLSRKVFKIGEKDYPKNSLTTIERQQPFKIITTRKLYPGKHRLSIIINGIEGEPLDFELVDQP